jgi:hypothetical protein
MAGRVGGGRPEAVLRVLGRRCPIASLRRACLYSSACPRLRAPAAGGCVMARMTSCKACGAMISAEASICPRCGANFNRTLVAPVGIAIMLAIAVLYALFQRYR